MNLSPLQDLGINTRILQTLGDEEEAWYRHGADFDSVVRVRQWLKGRPLICSSSGNPLGDDEDGWARS